MNLPVSGLLLKTDESRYNVQVCDATMLSMDDMPGQ